MRVVFVGHSAGGGGGYEVWGGAGSEKTPPIEYTTIFTCLSTTGFAAHESHFACGGFKWMFSRVERFKYKK